MRLGVNIDHIATIRQARGTSYPSIVDAVRIAESSGADSITLHLREDRRHMQDQDLFDLKPIIQTKMNLEMAATEEMLKIALEIMPEDVCIVPERREERTTEGGLDLKNYFSQIKTIVRELADHGRRRRRRRRSVSCSALLVVSFSSCGQSYGWDVPTWLECLIHSVPRQFKYRGMRRPKISTSSFFKLD